MIVLSRFHGFFIGFAVLATVALGAILLFPTSARPAVSAKPPEGYRILRTATGFSPSNLIIPKGEAVTFATELSEPFWPASNIHPTHQIYPEFDPGRPLEVGEEWSFTFAREGRFRFHDHLFASAGGLVVVIDPTKRLATAPARLHDCENVPADGKVSCWDELLAYTLREKGFDRAFDLFIALYRTEPNVPKGCHGWGHALGEEAYKLYREGEQFELRPEASYCGYGFYHGFLENLVGETGDASEAYAFCIGVRDGKDAELKYNNCIHGIGHGGAASIIESPEMQGKYQESIDQGIALCRSFTEDPAELRNCFDGVFNELVLDMWNSKYGLSREKLFLQNDPFAFCEAQTRVLQPSCYFEYMGVFEQVFDGDFERAAHYVARAISNDTLGAIALKKLSADFMQGDIVNESYEENVRVCRTLREKLEEACVGGIGVGLIAHGEPGREYLKAVPFCASVLLTNRERTACFGSTLSHFKAVYSQKNMREACRMTPPQYRSPHCTSIPL